VTSRNKNQK